MKKFILNVLLFLVVFILISVICILIPTTPRMLTSPIYAKTQKDSLLSYTSGPRIIFLGGSNLPYSLNSKMIKDSLGLNPVNTGIMHTIGLKSILNNYVDKWVANDIVIIAPEYQQFFGDFMHGHESTLYYNSVNNINLLRDLDYYQIKAVSPYLPKYIFKKLDPREYFGYSVKKYFNSQAFNQYGDLQTHWMLKPIPFSSHDGIKDEFNQDVIDYLLSFQDLISNMDVKLYITPPPYNQSSAENNTKQIRLVERKLKEAGLKIIGNFENYILPDSLFFNSPYHLTKSGVELRTKMFISDFDSQMRN